VKQTRRLTWFSSKLNGWLKHCDRGMNFDYTFINRLAELESTLHG
jgi:hypothetical protein